MPDRTATLSSTIASFFRSVDKVLVENPAKRGMIRLFGGSVSNSDIFYHGVGCGARHDRIRKGIPAAYHSQNPKTTVTSKSASAESECRGLIIDVVSTGSDRHTESGDSLVDEDKSQHNIAQEGSRND